jgi:hypothetical protein
MAPEARAKLEAECAAAQAEAAVRWADWTPASQTLQAEEGHCPDGSDGANGSGEVQGAIREPVPSRRQVGRAVETMSRKLWTLVARVGV